MTQYRYASSIHPSREALHASLAEMHFGHLFIDDMIAIIERDEGVGPDLAIVREGIESEIRALPTDEDDRDMLDAVDVHGALEADLFCRALEDIAIGKATDYLQEFYDDRFEVVRADQGGYNAFIGERCVRTFYSLSELKRFSY